jgi:hypothetical protein
VTYFDLLSALTPREAAIAIGKCAGERDVQIAERFKCSERTVRRDRAKAKVQAAINAFREERATELTDGVRELGRLAVDRLRTELVEGGDDAVRIALAIVRDGGLLSNLAAAHAGATSVEGIEQSRARGAELDELIADIDADILGTLRR